MTIVWKGPDFDCLSSDTKPTNVPTNTKAYETNTKKTFVFNGTSYDEITTSGATTLDGLTDVTITSPANGHVPTYNSTSGQWENSAPPGAGGGEANTLGSVGTGEGTLPGTKVGTTLNVKSLKQGTNVTLTNNTNDVTITSAYPPDATTSVKGIAELATDGESAANVVVQGNDSRLSNSRTPTAHKDSHKSGGGDTFAKGDDLNASAKYLEDVADPASDAQRIWLADGTADLKYWSDEGSPVKHTVATASSTTTFTNKSFDADGTGNSITNIENADIKSGAAIAYSKLSLSNSILNADVNASAAIATTKLADSANFILKTLDNSFGAHYHDITKMTAPGNPSANDLRIYVDTSDTHLKVKNSAGTVVDLHSAGGGITASSSDTLTNKTINPTNNTMLYLSPYAYTIYQDGGFCKARNNKTGAITSNANIDPLIVTILGTSDPSVEIQPGFYDLSVGFSGFNMVTNAHIKGVEWATFNVPAGYTGAVFKFSPNDVNIFNASVEGIFLDEQVTRAYDWTAFEFAPVYSTKGGVVACRVENCRVWHAKYVIRFSTNGLSWGSDNRFINIFAEVSEYLIWYEHTGTFTADASGFYTCKFENVTLQATASNPQTLGGIIGVLGDWNQFQDCNIWDLQASNSSASSMTISANARGTQIIGGLLTHRLFTDSGTRTIINDDWTGLQMKKPAKFYDNVEIQKNTATPLSIYRPSNVNFDEASIAFDLQDSNSNRTTFGRMFVGENSNTDGAEESYYGFEYYLAGTTALRGAFMGNGVAFGVGSGNTRVRLLNTGISGSNKDFTFPNASGEIATIAATQTLTNKTLTTPVISSITNSGNTLTLPTTADTIVGRATTDTLTNKTISDLKETWQSKSAAYTMVDTDYGIFLTGTGTYTVTLPAVSGRTGKIYKFVKTGASGTVTLDGNASETINGATTQTITTQYQFVELICDGTAWFLHRMAP